MSVFFFGPEDPFLKLFPGVLLMPILAAAVAGDVTLRGKDSLFICRKAPYGERRYVRAVLLKSWMVAVPLGALVMVVATALSPQADSISILWNAGFIAQLTAAATMASVGLFLLVRVPSENPKDKRMTMFIVAQIFVFISLPLFIFSLELLGEPDGLLLLHAPVMWLLAVVFLLLGSRRLRSIE